MKKYSRLFLVTLFIIYSNGQIKGKELGYSTTQIREMWYICSTELKKKIPKISEENKILLCDCYVNHLRKKFTAKEVLNLSNEESYELGIEVSKMCKISEEFQVDSFAVGAI